MFVKLSQGDFGLVELPNWPDFVQLEVVNNGNGYYVVVSMAHVEIKIETVSFQITNVYATNYGAGETVTGEDNSVEQIVQSLVEMGILHWHSYLDAATKEICLDKPVYRLSDRLKAQLAVIEEWWRIEKGGSFKPYDEFSPDNTELAKIVVGQSEAMFYSMEENIATVMMQRFPTPLVIYNVNRDIGKKKAAGFFEAVLDLIKRGVIRMTYEQGMQNLHLSSEFRSHAMLLDAGATSSPSDNKNFEESNPDTMELARIAAGGVSAQRDSLEAKVVCYLYSISPSVKSIESFRNSLPNAEKDLTVFNSTIHDLERRGIVHTEHNGISFYSSKEFNDLVVKFTSGQYRR